MASALDDEELSMSISSTNTRRPPAPPSNRREHENKAPQPVERTQVPARTSQRLGQYQIISTLGEGSFGKVKLATHQVTGQKVALKIIQRRKLVTRDMAGRIEREIQYLQLLRHPHIIKL
jgi:carbon catabolite-derepressing protein kinase